MTDDSNADRIRLTAPQARARLSGTLIGAELAAARPYWLGQKVAVIGAQAVSATYLRALRARSTSCSSSSGSVTVFSVSRVTRSLAR